MQNNRTVHFLFSLTLAMVSQRVPAAEPAPSPPSPETVLCGVVQASCTLVDFAAGYDLLEAKGVSIATNGRLEVRYDQAGAALALLAPEAGWEVDDAVVLALDVENIGTRPITLLGKLNNRITTASLIHLKPGEQESMLLYLFRKAGPRAFEGMRGAPGGDVRFWDGYESPVIIRTLELSDLNGQALGGTVALHSLRAIGLRLELDPPEADFFPFVDRFGQYKHNSWRNKVTRLEHMHTLAAQEAAQLQTRSRPAGWNRYGGWADGPQLEATGHFRTEKVDGRWWLVDPGGQLFWSTGVNGVRSHTPTRIEGRERYFTGVSGMQLVNGTYDFSKQNLELKYGDDWQAHYARLCHQRLSAWGMNTMGNWSVPEIVALRRTPYVVAIDLGNKHGDRRGDETRLRDVLRKRLARYAGAAEDPWCIGYFIDNELNWKYVPDIDLYFRVVHEEIRRAAPRKLYLGSRIHNNNTEALAASAEYTDVISINCYEHSPVDTPHDAPYIIGEFHFGALDRGMLGTGLRSASNQRQRAYSYQHYMREAIKRPNIVGAHWFTYREQALTGRSDGENYQVGLVDICDTPYIEMTEAIREIAEALYPLHQGQLEANSSTMEP